MTTDEQHKSLQQWFAKKTKKQTQSCTAALSTQNPLVKTHLIGATPAHQVGQIRLLVSRAVSPDGRPTSSTFSQSG